ncbi:glycosyltransferase [Pelagicoccus sp. SDUM812002]|uniref:glycosyltransferase n=1 Tax=Pelagicoccus sp. SDUM812002 TaxID=3041266 RepID=UPI00280CBBB2|nr:glycosyltransferase [Pelagicoccus sp. SDUM812002]MDQ8184963.1 glycosyltransferase [Pelagicoccus sp. SDUM812002]
MPTQPRSHSDALRVLHYCGRFSTLSETFIYDLVKGLDQQGIENHVVTHERLRPKSRPFPRVHVLKKSSPRSLECLARRVWMKASTGDASGALWLTGRRHLRRIVQTVKPDLIHAHFGPLGAKIAPVSEKEGIPLVTTFHGYDATWYPRDHFWHGQLSQLCRTESASVGVSENICNKVRLLGAPERSVVKIANGVDLEQFPYQSPTSGFNGSQVEWLFVGRLVPKKGILYLLESFRRAKARTPRSIQLKLHIIGDGPEKEALIAARQQAGLQESVEVHGAKPHHFVREMMKRCHLLAQHSVTSSDGDQEGQPVSLIEAAASGLPIVSTRHSGIPEVVIEGKNGYLVDERDVETMADRMAQLNSHPESWEAMSLYGRKHAEQNLQLPTQLEAWKSLYFKLCNIATDPQQAPALQPELVKSGSF